MQAELRGEPTDQPAQAREPAESRGPIDVERIKDLTALGDAKAQDPRVRMYDPLDQAKPRADREPDSEPASSGIDRPGLLSLRDRMRAASDKRFKPDEDKGPDQVEETAEAAERRDPEVLHRFGNKDHPRDVRPKDLELKSWDDIVGPYAPTSPADRVLGASTFIDPYHPDVKMSGKYHRLPEDFQPPEESGLGIHADGRDVSRYAPHGWGHRTIYPTVPMTAAEFARRVDELPWEYAGNKRDRR